MTRDQDFDYIGQIVTYTCKPGYEFTDEDLEPVNVTEYIRENHSKLTPERFNIANFLFVQSKSQETLKMCSSQWGAYSPATGQRLLGTTGSHQTWRGR